MAANNHVVTNINSNNEIEKKKVMDSDGDPKAAAKRKAERTRQVIPFASLGVTTVLKVELKMVGRKPPLLTRSRNTTMYGKISKLESRAKEAVNLSSNPPTPEWLQREGAKLASAAASTSSSFLQLQTSASSSSTDVSTETPVLQAFATDESHLVLLRPTRAKYCTPTVSETRRIESSIFELVRPKKTRLV